MEKRNELWEVDKKLFASMENHYQSQNEKTFFKNMEYKQEYEVALANDLIVSEKDNKDLVYLVRVEYDEYIIGRGYGDDNEKHVMNLASALSINLRELGLDRNITLFQWLRERDYSGVMYDHNYDLI